MCQVRLHKHENLLSGRMCFEGRLLVQLIDLINLLMIYFKDQSLVRTEHLDYVQRGKRDIALSSLSCQKKIAPL